LDHGADGRVISVLLHHLRHDALASKGDQRSRVGTLPQLRVTAHQRQSGVPEEHSAGEVERSDDRNVTLQRIVTLKNKKKKQYENNKQTNTREQ
jgi:hypothetical protein